MIRELCLVVFLLMPLLLPPVLVAAQGKVTVSILLHDRDRQRVIIANYREDDIKPKTIGVPHRAFRGLLEEPGVVVTGGAGRFWVVGSMGDRMLVLDAATGHSRHFWLRKFELKEAGGYFPYGALALNRNRLFVGHNYGAYIVDAKGLTIAEKTYTWLPVLHKVSYRGFRDVRNMGKEDPDFDATWGSRLVPAGVSDGVIGGFYADYFELIDLRLQARAAFTFDGLEILGAAPLKNGAWLVIGKDDKRRKLWTAIVNVKGGKQKAQALPVVTLGSANNSQILCDVAVTQSRVWTLIRSADAPGPKTLLAWRTDGRYHGVSIISNIERILGGLRNCLYSIENIGGRRNLVQRKDSTLQVVRSYSLPPGSWQARAFALGQDD